jgi:hypothetical protein
MIERRVALVSLLLIPCCELYTAPDRAKLAQNPEVAPGNPVQDGGGGCGGEAAAGGFVSGESNGPTNPDNPYANAVDLGAGLPCAAVGFNEHEIYCRFFETCLLPCQSAADCPVMAGAPAPDCRASNGGPTCVLPCNDTSECPSGMTCVLTTIGLDRACMWGFGPSTAH